MALSIIFTVFGLPVLLILLFLDHIGVMRLPTFDWKSLLTMGDSLAFLVIVGPLVIALGVGVLLVAYSILIWLATKIVEGISTALSQLTAYPKILDGSKLASWILFVVGFALDFLAS